MSPGPSRASAPVLSRRCLMHWQEWGASESLWMAVTPREPLSELMQRITVPMIGGTVSAAVLTLTYTAPVKVGGVQGLANNYPHRLAGRRNEQRRTRLMGNMMGVGTMWSMA